MAAEESKARDRHRSGTSAIKRSATAGPRAGASAGTGAGAGGGAASRSSGAASGRMVGGNAKMAFEIFGKVQGVFFRKHTKKTAQKLGLVGWVENTPRGTVVGEAQGPSAAVADLKRWLQTTGSPKSRIDKSVFSGEGPAARLTYRDFSVRR